MYSLEVAVEPLLIFHSQPGAHELRVLVDRVENEVAANELGGGHGRHGARARVRELDELFEEQRRAVKWLVRLVGSRERARGAERRAAIRDRVLDVQAARERHAGADDP